MWRDEERRWYAERNAEIVARYRGGHGVGIEELGRDYCLTRERVRQILTKRGAYEPKPVPTYEEVLARHSLIGALREAGLTWRAISRIDGVAVERVRQIHAGFAARLHHQRRFRQQVANIGFVGAAIEEALT